MQTYRVTFLMNVGHPTVTAQSYPFKARDWEEANALASVHLAHQDSTTRIVSLEEMEAGFTYMLRVGSLSCVSSPRNRPKECPNLLHGRYDGETHLCSTCTEESYVIDGDGFAP